MVVPRTSHQKSATAIRAASTEPSPLRSLYSPDMSVRTPIFMARSCACPSTAPKLLNVVAASCASNQPAINHTRETNLLNKIMKVLLRILAVVKPQNDETIAHWKRRKAMRVYERRGNVLLADLRTAESAS